MSSELLDLKKYFNLLKNLSGVAVYLEKTDNKPASAFVFHTNSLVIFVRFIMPSSCLAGVFISFQQTSLCLNQLKNLILFKERTGNMSMNIAGHLYLI